MKSISEKTDEKEQELLEYLNSLPGDQSNFINLFKDITKAHSKNVDFRNKAFKIFRRELVLRKMWLGFHFLKTWCLLVLYSEGGVVLFVVV